MSMTTIQKVDRHDPDRAELTLIRCGHHLWLGRKRALKASDAPLVRALDASLETVWELKRIVRAELKVKRAAAAATLRQYWKERKEAKEALPLAA